VIKISDKEQKAAAASPGVKRSKRKRLPEAARRSQVRAAALTLRLGQMLYDRLNPDWEDPKWIVGSPRTGGIVRIHSAGCAANKCDGLECDGVALTISKDGIVVQATR